MPSTTAIDIITDALYELGVYGPGDSVAAADAELGLRHFNRMIASSNARSDMIYTRLITVHTLTINQQSYTIGVDPAGVLPTADLTGARPQRITKANLFLPTSPTIRRPIDVIGDGEWSRIRLQAIYTYPQKLYNDGAHPQSTLYFWPIPDGAYQVELYTWQANGQITALTDAVEFPPGYEDIWLYGLAVRLARPFGKPVPEDTLTAYRKAAATVQSLNSRPPRLDADPFGGDGGADLFNWLSRETS